MLFLDFYSYEVWDTLMKESIYLGGGGGLRLREPAQSNPRRSGGACLHESPGQGRPGEECSAYPVLHRVQRTVHSTPPPAVLTRPKRGQGSGPCPHRSWRGPTLNLSNRQPWTLGNLGLSATLNLGGRVPPRNGRSTPGAERRCPDPGRPPARPAAAATGPQRAPATPQGPQPHPPTSLHPPTRPPPI